MDDLNSSISYMSLRDNSPVRYNDNALSNDRIEFNKKKIIKSIVMSFNKLRFIDRDSFHSLFYKNHNKDSFVYEEYLDFCCDPFRYYNNHPEFQDIIDKLLLK